MACSNNVEVTVSDQVTVVISNTACSSTAEVGEVGWKKHTVDIDTPSFTVQHDLLKKANIAPIIFVDGSPLRWEKAGVTRDITTGVMTFPFLVADEIIFEYK